MSSDWEASPKDVTNSNNFTASRKINMEGFVGQAAGYAQGCAAAGCGNGSLTDNFPNDPGTRAMGYYDEGFLNYYYYMASQFAISDRWFSPVASKTTPNRIASVTGGTTQGLVRDPFRDDNTRRPIGDSNHLRRTNESRSVVEDLLRHYPRWLHGPG